MVIQTTHANCFTPGIYKWWQLLMNPRCRVSYAWVYLITTLNTAHTCSEPSLKKCTWRLALAFKTYQIGSTNKYLYLTRDRIKEINKQTNTKNQQQQQKTKPKWLQMVQSWPSWPTTFLTKKDLWALQRIPAQPPVFTETQQQIEEKHSI